MTFIRPTHTLVCGLLCVLLTSHQNNAVADDAVGADLLLKGGTIHTGDGQPGQLGDVAISDGKIVAVGEFQAGLIKRTVDCTGYIVSPGFIDLHSHSDGPIVRKETRLAANFLTQGCTTALTGNCGSGPVDVGEFYETVDEYGAGINIAHLLPQGSLRRKVLGSERRAATADEMHEMTSLTKKAMEDGAWGMSTGLIYVPSSYADTKELIQTARVVAKHGGIYVSHIRGEGTGLLAAVDEAIKIGQEAELPVHVSHFKSSGKNSWGLVRVAIDRIEELRAKGQQITADQYPYIASSTSLAATFLPAWARAGGSQKMLERLNNSDDSERIHRAIRRKLELTNQGELIQIARYRPKPQWAGMRISEIAADQKTAPFDLLIEMLQKDSGTKVVNFGISEEDVRYVMKRPWVATASDGSARIPSEEVPHPRNYGTFPRKIGHYSVQEQVIDLPHAIRSATGLPADILGLQDRGYLRVGYAADIAVWKKQELIDQATFKAPDRYSTGIRYLLVNGVPAIWDSNITGALAGKALRHSSNEREMPSVSSVVRKYFPIGSSGGLAVLVTKDGKVIHSRGYGTVRNNQRVTSRTQLSLASITKQYAAMCVAMLVEAGKLDLDEPVSTYLPDLDLPTNGRELLVRDLIRHTSGLANFIKQNEKESIAEFKKRHNLTWLSNTTHAQWLATTQLKRPPGTEYEYTNSGYVLLARLIEVTSGRPFHEFQKQRIFDVLEFKDSSDSTRFNGSGSMRTSLRDYAIWDQALWDKNEMLLSRQGFDMLFQRGTLDDGTPVDYGFGWKLTYEDDKLVTAEHGGWGSGTTAARNQIKRFIDDRITVAVFAQEHPEFGRKNEAGEKIREVIVDEIYKAVR
ncbi:serine hydrolase [Thalassoroseus pseudoceratinae]|uniref:serine hydrolase n=1 Tax=Thalassoroseus pseudoceratinae TaxID=2713176 RepID=UPI0014225A79|nr:serine hydrolase [Thalassoroseus pseudoceratinae]